MDKKSILKVGRNCWRICRAEKISFLIDGEQYFSGLHDSLYLANQQVMVLAWDIYSQLKLIPEETTEDSDKPVALEPLLDYLLKQKPSLQVNILSWDFTLLFALSREFMPIYKMDWKTHRRLKFCLDDQYPLGASHHQKIVVIDNSLAFSGGLDLTRGRWDTQDHDAQNPKRALIDGTTLPVRPYHDVQMAVSGQAAAALGSLARERWRRATGRELPVPEKTHTDVWPDNLKVDIEDVDVAIVRTEPAFNDYAEVREVEQLYIDAIAAAENYIYIENQFFTAPAISRALERRLKEENGPEIILNLPFNTEGWLSQQSMDMMRIKLINTLTEADTHKRLAVYYPYKPGPVEESINLHAKLMIVDDRFVRVGSANLNNRSMGLDTECDLAIEVEATNHRVCHAIHHFRNRLLAEHLNTTSDDIDSQEKSKETQHKSLIEVIESLRREGRSLRPLRPELPVPDERTLQDIQLTDPEGPVSTDKILSYFVPETTSKPAALRITGWIIILLVLLGLAAMWRFTPLNEMMDISSLSAMVESWKDSNFTPLLVIVAFVIAGLLVMPVTALIIVAVLVFGPLTGFIYALSGSVMSALSGYAIGSVLGKNMVRQLAGKRINQVSRQLAQRGILTMSIVRIVPVAPFTIINLVAGASHIRFRDYFLGTLAGMTPGVLGVTLLTDSVQTTIVSPGWQSILSLITVTVVVFSVAYFLSRQLLMAARNKKDNKINCKAEQASC